jgi:uncharacterized protein YrrD
MQRSLRKIVGYGLVARDGELGKVADFLFDDEVWLIRYLVVELNGWRHGRKVLLAPAVLGVPQWASRSLPVNLTRQQVADSPDIDTEAPVFRRHEVELSNYYTWPVYWGGGQGAEQISPYPGRGEEAEQSEPHLHSASRFYGSHIRATDGEIGHVEDLIADDVGWAVGFLVGHTASLLPGKKVLLAPQWIERVSWQEAKVYVNLSQQAVRDSPPFDPSRPLGPEDEQRLFDYYGRPRRPSG